MRNKRLLALLLVLSLFLALFPASAAPRYLPHAGDQFSYRETIDVANGAGYYEGYSDHTDVTGNETMTGILPNGTVTSNYGFAWNFRDYSGVTKNAASSGNFTWEPITFLYLQRTDNQTRTSPGLKVWFYMDNTTRDTSGYFYLLDTPMLVKSTNYGYYLQSESRYVKTIFTEGSANYFRSDAYGNYNAAYTWRVYFDPSTGYIVGYTWDEHDSNAAGDSFTYTENLYVTSTTYPLAAGTAPPSALAGILFAAGIILAIIIVFVIIVVVLVRRSRRMKLPKHAYQQEYRPPVPSPMPAPSIDLTPKQPPVQQIVIKEVVKVNCKYCGALIDSTVQTCPICGAPRT